MSNEVVRTETLGNGVLRLVFNRPAKMNAMNRAMMTALIEALSRASSDPAVHVIILTGEGHAFMAGADLLEYASSDALAFREFQRWGRTLYDLVEHNAKPTIAAVNGLCLGGGFEMALSCDIIPAADNAVFGLPEINLGLVPGGSGVSRLVLRAGFGRAIAASLTGNQIPATTLEQWGVINEISARAELQSAAARLAELLAVRPPAATQMIKRLARGTVGEISPLVKATELDGLAQLFESPYAQEKLSKFVRKSALPARQNAAAATAPRVS